MGLTIFTEKQLQRMRLPLPAPGIQETGLLIQSNSHNPNETAGFVMYISEYCMSFLVSTMYVIRFHPDFLLYPSLLKLLYRAIFIESMKLLCDRLLLWNPRTQSLISYLHTLI